MYNRISAILGNKDHLTLGVVFVCLAVLLLLPKPTVTPVEEKVTENLPEETIGQNAVASHDSTVPTVLRIPRIGVEARFTTPLGLKPNGEVQVPADFDSVGWYQYSPKPGELGPSVVLGHVDSRSGPAVFYSLGQLEVGDEISITDEQGIEHVFIVEHSERYEQSSFPTQLVYGDIDYAGLRLITCSGWYDRTSDRYSHNRVVFARLVE